MNQAPRLGAVTAVVALLLGGCGGGGEPSAGPTAAGTTGATDATPGASASATPSVAPATGRLMKLPGASVRAPERWTLTRDAVTLSWEAREPEAFGSVFLYQAGGTVTTLDRLVEIGALSSFRGEPEISYDVELDGEPAFRAVGEDAIGPFVTYGAVRGDRGVTLSFGIDEYIPAKQRRRIEESVVATFQWR